MGNDAFDSFEEEHRQIIYRFLTLIRDNYKKADKAAYFLERRAGVSNICAITNLRDVLSHLATLLALDTPSDKRRDQLANAEEHLRRSIIEPYEMALGELAGNFKTLYDRYCEQLLPVKDRHPSLHGAPNEIQIKAQLSEIDGFAESGKRAKARNLWDDDWEVGVEGLAAAFDKLSDLKEELDSYWFRFEQIQRDIKASESEVVQTRLGTRGITATIITFFLGCALTYYITNQQPATFASPLPVPSPVKR